MCAVEIRGEVALEIPELVPDVEFEYECECWPEPIFGCPEWCW